MKAMMLYSLLIAGTCLAQQPFFSSDTLWYHASGVRMADKSQAAWYECVDMEAGKQMRISSWFYPSGKPRTDIVVDWAHGNGTLTSWHPNGRLCEKDLLQFPEEDAAMQHPYIRFLSCQDSTGKAMISKGSGKYLRWNARRTQAEYFSIAYGELGGAIHYQFPRGEAFEVMPSYMASRDQLDLSFPFYRLEKEAQPINFEEIYHKVGYPQGTRAKEITGDVTVRVLVNASGAVTEAKIISGGDKLLEDAVMIHIHDLRFSPAVMDRRATACRVNVLFSFR